jgi:hypothetical protein
MTSTPSHVSLKPDHTPGKRKPQVVTSRKRLVGDADNEADDDSNSTETETICTQDAEGVPARAAPLASSTFKQTLSRTQTALRSDGRTFDSRPMHPSPIQSAEQSADVRGSLASAPVHPSSPLPRSQERFSASKRSDLPPRLSPELQPFLIVQKSVSLRLLGRPRQTLPSDPGDAGRRIDTVGSLLDLLKGTVLRGEGNSCLLLGPRGSGKTMVRQDVPSEMPWWIDNSSPQVVEEVISRLEDQADITDDPSLIPIVIRLSGHVHVNDRIALTEIGRQLIRQNGPSNVPLPQPEDDEEGIEEDDITPEDEEIRAQVRYALLMVS